MYQDDVPASGPSSVPASSRAPDQVWFSMILVNDPNAALFGALRPSRPHPFVAAVRRPFERLAPAAARPVSEPLERVPALRPRWSRWVAAAGVLALGFGLAEAALEALTSSGRPPAVAVAALRVGSTSLETPLPAARAASSGTAAGFALSAAAIANGAAPTSTAPAGHVSGPRATPTSTSVSAGLRTPESSSPARAAAEAAPSAPRAAARATTSVKKKAAARQRQRAFRRGSATRRSAPR